MLYYNPSTKETLNRHDLSLKFNTSIPKKAEEFNGWFKVYYEDMPSTNEFQSIKENPISLIGGKYTRTYSTVDMELSRAKEIKKERLTKSFDEAYDSKDLSVSSALGFEINANSVANTNIDGLIKVINKTGVETVLFRDFNNQMHEVTLADLETMQLEIIMNGQQLYAKKWQIEVAIDGAESIEGLLEIEDNFAEVI